MSIELDAALHWLKAMDNKAMGEEVQGHARVLLDAFALPRECEPALPRGSTSDEKAALEWLDECEATYTKALPSVLVSAFLQCVRTLKAMLARPVMPKEPTREALEAIDSAINNGGGADWRVRMYRALRSHLSAPTPAPATETVWRAEWGAEDGAGATSDDLRTADDALRLAREYLLRNSGCMVSVYQRKA